MVNATEQIIGLIPVVIATKITLDVTDRLLMNDNFTKIGKRFF